MSPGWGVVKSLAIRAWRPVGLVHTQKIEAQSEKPTWTKALEFTQFACPCGTDPRLLSGEQRTSHFKLVTSVGTHCGTRHRWQASASVLAARSSDGEWVMHVLVNGLRLFFDVEGA